LEIEQVELMELSIDLPSPEKQLRRNQIEDSPSLGKQLRRNQIEDKMRKALNESEPDVKTHVKRRPMHNLKLFKTMSNHVEKNIGKEINRLTTDNALWRILSACGLLPKRRIEGYGSFIKYAEPQELTVEYMLKLEKWSKNINKTINDPEEEENVMDSL
jgi:hypothetical protein